MRVNKHRRVQLLNTKRELSATEYCVQTTVPAKSENIFEDLPSSLSIIGYPCSV